MRRWGFTTPRLRRGACQRSRTFAKKILADKARSGVRVRILLGDPASEQVAIRGADEGVDDAMAAKIRNALVQYRKLRTIEGAEFRIFRDSTHWLERVDNLAMEVHNQVGDPTEIVDRLRAAGFKVTVGGNIGAPLSAQVPASTPETPTVRASLTGALRPTGLHRAIIRPMT